MKNMFKLHKNGHEKQTLIVNFDIFVYFGQEGRMQRLGKPLYLITRVIKNIPEDAESCPLSDKPKLKDEGL